ncbi:MAG: CsgG/HfaB family protein [Candidatus Eisenbacteria bacterium]
MCAPPRTLVALLPLADQTDRTWELWTGECPARMVAAGVADSLEQGLGRTVVRLGTSGTPQRPTRPVDDDEALRVARAARAEIAVTGTVSVFSHDDHREAGRFGRWGVGAPDARSRVQVRVTLRVLDVADGSVIIETTASRERTGRGTASASRLEAGASVDAVAEDVLADVLADLARTIGQRLDARWQARVILEGPGIYVLDAGAARGLFPGERFEVWRSGVEVYDENLMHVGDDSRVGAVVIVALEGHGRARARLAEGEARMGDTVRPCSSDGGPALSLRR